MVYYHLAIYMNSDDTILRQYMSYYNFYDTGNIAGITAMSGGNWTGSTYHTIAT